MSIGVSGVSVAKLADCVAPGLLVAQGIGRFGNWWNQELFGKPTDLPWGLEISIDQRPLPYVDQATFHPTFLYEALWCFGAALLLLLIERLFRLRPGGLFALYVLVYSIGRFWIETLEMVREAIGDDCAVASRIALDALGPYGVEVDEGLAFIRLADHLVDLWDVCVGSALEWSKDSGASSLFEAGWQLPCVR